MCRTAGVLSVLDLDIPPSVRQLVQFSVNLLPLPPYPPTLTLPLSCTSGVNTARKKPSSLRYLSFVSKVAVEEAQLGTLEEVVECVKSADILKPAKSAAKGLMAVISGDEGGSGYVGQVIRRTGVLV